jgi:1-acyl-sn-glycerol-3-phosphate acyltransferase
LIFGLCAVMALGCFLAIFRYGDSGLNQYIMNLYSRYGTRIGLRTKVENMEGMTRHQPCIYMGNHQSGLDVAVYGAVFPDRTVAIGKTELLYIPFFGLFWKAGRNLLIDRSNRKKAFLSLRKASDLCIKERLNVGIFPEGTRNKELEGLLPFKKGGFVLAVQSQFPIVPLVVESYKKIGALESGRVKAGEIGIKVLEPIETKGKTTRDIPELMEQVRAVMLEAQGEFERSST